MKEKHIILIFRIIIVLLFICFFYTWYYLENGKDKMEDQELYYNICKEYNESYNKDEIINKYSGIVNFEYLHCGLYSNKTHTAYFIYSYILFNNFLAPSIIPFYIPIIIIFPFMYKLTKEFRNKYIKNYLQRKSYKDYIKRIIGIAYKELLFVPVLFLLVFIFSIFLSKFNLDPYGEPNLYLSISKKLLTKDYFIIFYAINMLLQFAYYINTGLLVLSNNKNTIISIVKAFLIIYIMWFVNEIIICTNLSKIFNIDLLHFSMLNIYKWSSITSIKAFTLYNLSFFLISFILVIISYKNKDRIMQMIER